jgi:lipopolysaccharide transport system permease protein
METLSKTEATPVDTLVAEPPAASAALGRKPYLTIRPDKGWVPLNLPEMWQFRDLMFALALRDIKLRYKQTALGVIWVVLQPLMAAGIITFVFGSVAHMKSGPIPYFLFSYAGTTAWGLFNNVLSKAGGSLVGNTQLISKVYFPRLILPLSSLPSSFLDFGIALAMLAVLLIVNHIVPTFAMLLMPVWIAVLMLYALGIGLVVTSLMVSYRDVGYMLPLAMQILFYACPIAYPASNIPAKAEFWYHLNPLASLFEAYTWSVFNVGTPDWTRLAIASAVGVLAFFVGVFSFKRMEKKFADVI